MMFMFLTIWLLTMLFLFMNHPLSMGFILLLQTIALSIFTGLMNYNFWFSYMLFLVMVSGLMIMFIYMTSIASNEMFSMPKNMMNLFLFISMISLLMLFLSDNFYSMLFTSMSPSLNQILLLNISYNSLTKFLNYPHLLLILFLMNYLLLTLIVIIKITELNKGPLRQK